MQAHLDIDADQEEKYEFVINVSTGKLDFEEIESWLMDRIITF
jgi:hypothetical protein